MSELSIGMMLGAALALYIELIIGLLVGWWATREDADGEDREEWPEPKSINFTVTTDGK